MPVYVLHIEPPYKHAKHYIGYTTHPIPERVARHFAGRGSPLIKAALDAGCEVNVAHQWMCGTRGFERNLKNRKNTPYWCKLCGIYRKRKPAFSRYMRRKND